MVHERIKNFKCTLCDSTFYNQSGLTIHINGVHENQRPFKCPECEASFKLKGHVQQHIDGVHRGIKVSFSEIKRQEEFII